MKMPKCQKKNRANFFECLFAFIGCPTGQVSQEPKSKSKVLRIHRHRATNHRVFEEIAERNKWSNKEKTQPKHTGRTFEKQNQAAESAQNRIQEENGGILQTIIESTGATRVH